MGSRRVLAVVVTFHPDLAGLAALLRQLAVQVESIVIVDNTPEAVDWGGIIESPSRDGSLRLVSLGENRGIAAAQNVGIRIGLTEGFDYVLLSDQDSLPTPTMVAELVETTETLTREGIAVGCVCPAYFDETTGQAYRFQVHRPGDVFYSTMAGEQAVPYIEIVTAISSGTVISVETLRMVGGMREDFFIDDVDTEWCHRARSLGFRNFGTACARLNHRLGDSPFRVWYFGWRQMSEYSTVRLYYRFRNFVLMIRLPHVPLRWTVRACWFWLGNMYAHCLFAAHPWDNARAIMRGLWDGLKGRSGVMRGTR